MKISNKSKSAVAPDNSQPLDIPAEKFQAEVLESSQPVLVEFWTPWSRSCQVFEPVLNEVTRVCAGKVKVVKINADDSLDLSVVYDIQSIPTLIYFIAGQPHVRIVGTASKEAILAKLKACGLPEINNTK